MRKQSVFDEAIRYLGAEGAEINETLHNLVDHAIERVEFAAKKQYCVERVACCVTDHTVYLGTHSVSSRQVAEHLRGCDEVFLFAATLGAEVDRLLRRDTVVQLSLAVAEQAAAAAIVEQYCDDVCERLQLSLDGRYCCPRFSAGYGDFPLSEQRYLLHALDAPKRIGLSCTESFMLTPAKSVTAVIGIAKEPSQCYVKGCDCCAKTDCLFRRKT